MIGDAPEVTVVLLVKDPDDRFVRTADIVKAQEYAGGIKILVIDSSENPALAASAALRRRADHWEAIPPSSFTHAGTRQRALDLCDTPVVVYLSGDAHPVNERWLSRLVRPLAQREADASYGRQQPPDENAERQATFEFLYPRQLEIKSKSSVAALGLRAFHFSDVTSAFVTDVARAVGFPTELPIFEDVGIAKRLLDEGYRIAYVPDAVVAHAHSLRAADMFRHYVRIGSVYEQLGIFTELRAAGRSLVLEGLRTTKAIAPSRRRLPVPSARGVGVGALKVSAVAWGRFRYRMSGTADRTLTHSAS